MTQKAAWVLLTSLLALPVLAQTAGKPVDAASLPHLKIGAELTAARVPMDLTEGTFGPSRRFRPAAPILVLDFEKGVEKFRLDLYPLPTELIMDGPLTQNPRDSKREIFKNTLEPLWVSGPGLYAITPSYERKPVGTQFVAVGRKLGPPVEGNPAMLSGTPDGKLDVADRNLRVWFPFASLDVLRGSLEARFSVLRAAPPQLFVYASRDLSGEEGEADYGAGTTTSSDVKPTEAGTIIAGEPLLVVTSGNGNVYTLGSDGALFFHRGLTVATIPGNLIGGEPPAALAFPGKPRNTWTNREGMLARVPAKLKATIEAASAKVAKAEECRSAAELRFSQATENVITTAKAKEAASRRLEKERGACKLEQAYKPYKVALAKLQQGRDDLAARELAKLSAELAGRFAALAKP